MIKQLTFATALLVTSFAYAGSLSISVTTAATGTVTKSVTVSDADIGRMIAAYKGIYPQTCDASTPPVCHNSSNTEILSSFATGIFNGIQAVVKSQETAAVVKTDTSNVQPITMQ